MTPEDRLAALIAKANLPLPLVVEYDSETLGDYGPEVRWPWRIKGVCDFQNEEASDDVAESVVAVVNACPAALAVIRAARERPCNRFDVTPCRERPEIAPGDWCSLCKAIAAWDKDGAA